MFVASGQGLMAVISPNVKADRIGNCEFSNMVVRKFIYFSIASISSVMKVANFKGLETAFIKA